MGDHFDVIVIGAGIFGLATAVELAARGHAVAVIDRFGSGHAATSSTGKSRGIHIAYDHPFYVGLAQEAIRRWKDLEESSGRKILHLPVRSISVLRQNCKASSTRSAAKAGLSRSSTRRVCGGGSRILIQ